MTQAQFLQHAADYVYVPSISDAYTCCKGLELDHLSDYLDGLALRAKAASGD
jgi:hypothetical protein